MYSTFGFSLDFNILPTITGENLSFFKLLIVFSDFFLSTTITMPIPQLKTLNISLSSMFPICLMISNIFGSLIFFLWIQAFTPLGKILGIFSVIPPPVIFAIPLCLKNFVILKYLHKFLLVELGYLQFFFY